MKTVHQSVLIWYHPHEMQALVVDVERYPEFLPWCNQAQVLERNDAGMVAKIGISFAGVQQSFTTRNRHVGTSEVHVQLVDGPFSKLEGHWSFAPVGQGDERACKVSLHLTYGFASPVWAKLVGPVFDKIAANLVDAFVQRAQRLYG